MARRGGTMTGTLTAIWRILIWGLAAIMLVALWLNFQNNEVARESDTATEEGVATDAPAETTSASEETAVEGTARPGPDPELSDSDPAEAATDAAPDAEDLDLVAPSETEGTGTDGGEATATGTATDDSSGADDATDDGETEQDQ